MTALATAVAQAGTWHLDSSFGRRGVAGLPVREEGIDSLYPAGPGRQGSLLAPGAGGSVFVGGYSERKRGTFLVAEVSPHGTLVKSFGGGGVSVVAAIHSTPQEPPRMFGLPGGGLLVVGLDRTHRLVAVRLTARGRPERSFGRDGTAVYTLPATGGHAIIAAGGVESNGSILVAYYSREAPQPVNEPQIAPGLGEGPLGLTRLTPAGALDRSFGQAAVIREAAQSPSTRTQSAVGAAITESGAVLLAYEHGPAATGSFAEVPAVEELDPVGGDATGFGHDGVALLPFVPTFEGVSSVIFGGLFAAPGGEVEVSFGGDGELFRFTAAGIADQGFATAGHTGPVARSPATTVARDGETFSVVHRGALTVFGTLASGAPDPALGGSRGERLGASLPGRGAGEEQQLLQLLPIPHGLVIMVGEDMVRLSD